MASVKLDRPRSRTVKLDELHPADYNPRADLHPGDPDLENIRKSIETYGLVDDLVWNERSKTLVGGHQRLKVLREMGVEEVEVKVVDLSPGMERSLNIMLNKAVGRWDEPRLLELVDELGDMDDAGPTGWMDEELLPLRARNAPPAEQDEVPELPENPVTKPGDIWELGGHRLICGDATNPQHVEAVLAGATPFLMVTDPPYGVKYDPDWRNEAAEKGQLDYAARRVGRIKNDDVADWSPAWALAPSTVAYTWSPPGDLIIETGAALIKSGFSIRNQIIWRKPHRPISRGHYTYQHEPCWYAVKKGQPSRWCGPKMASTIWEIALDPNVKGGHSTQKPVECMARPIRNHDAPEVYDPFLGSGTTLIAAEQLNRRCFGMDIDAAYCDVAVERWENLTGGKAARQNRTTCNSP